jgi:chemotaxis regulatin CheY-phosphate phosphatase CheZ
MSAPTVPIDEQIEILRNVTDGRSSYLASLVARRQMTEAAAARQLDALEAALATLNFCREHQNNFRAWWAMRREERRDGGA